MGLQSVVTLGSYMAEYERVSQAEGERKPPHVKECAQSWFKMCDCKFSHDVIWMFSPVDMMTVKH